MDWIYFLLENFAAPLSVAFVCFVCAMLYSNRKVLKRIKKPLFVKIIDQNLNTFYNYGCNENSMILVENDCAEKTVCFGINIGDNIFKYKQVWTGYAIRSLPVSDFRQLIKNDYSIKFNLSHSGNLNSFYIELKSKLIEVIKKEIELNAKSQEVDIRLSEYVNDENDWKEIYELCIVIIPHSDWETVYDKITIKNLRFEKH